LRTFLVGVCFHRHEVQREWRTEVDNAGFGSCGLRNAALIVRIWKALEPAVPQRDQDVFVRPRLRQICHSRRSQNIFLPLPIDWGKPISPRPSRIRHSGVDAQGYVIGFPP